MFRIYTFDPNDYPQKEELCIPVETLNEVRTSIVNYCINDILNGINTPADEAMIAALQVDISYEFIRYLSKSNNTFFITNHAFDFFMVKYED